MHYFSQSCYLEPYMKVFSTAGMDQGQIGELTSRDWSKKNEKEVVMRTATFGKLVREISICAKRNDYKAVDEEGVEVVRKGLGDDLVVPMGLIAVLRRQKVLDSKNGKVYPCQKTKDDD
ncbi:hypothetical protein GLAREA_07862 [Glarea lozoyensis ATCC 20868]|uniref:Uncharacterized protein n=1 Tax=Glarea lozoyensis (strain ATCC 20868 / MF5171) TaxID=1116229 RepID=S3E2R0_GLAL2|nr:uncharacterized protein GLAREA_07862 [Glarea lozoyensis ATCC 20868]EPE32728.1 hypothetical protein GLAREA_07862 [Glarea lozoyensis ATCC 20868]